MLYDNIFKQKDRSELIDLLGQHESMNFDAKKALLGIVRSKEFFVSNYGHLIDRISEEVENEEQAIASFEYLKYLGLRIDQNNGIVKVSRLSRFYLVDGIGLLVGTLLVALVYFAWEDWKGIFLDGLAIVPLVRAITITIISILGLILMVRCLVRFIDFIGFEIVKDQKGLIIKKGSAPLTKGQFVDPNNLVIVADEDELSMVYLDETGKANKLISTKGGEKIRETLVQLNNLLTRQ